MTTGRLGLTATDVKKLLNPLEEPNGFLGTKSKVLSADVEESILDFEELTLARVPARYQSLFSHIDGQTLIESAFGSDAERTIVVGLSPISNVKIWRNFEGPWSDRNAFLYYGPDLYTVNEEAGIITLNGTLTRDDNLIATYDHGALPKCRVLRRIVTQMVAVDWARRLYADDDKFTAYLGWENQAFSDLARMRKGKGDNERLGILMFDELKLVNETRVTRSTSGQFDPDGGAL